MKFELDDKTVLQICSATAAGFGAYALGAPRQFQDFYYDASTPRSDVTTRWLGTYVVNGAATNLTVAMTDDPKTVKNCLKINGLVSSLVAGQLLYNGQKGLQKKDIAYSSAAGTAALAALCFWKGFAKAE